MAGLLHWYLRNQLPAAEAHRWEPYAVSDLDRPLLRVFRGQSYLDALGACD